MNKRRLLVAVGMIAVAAVLPMEGALAGPPDPLQVPEGQELLLRARAQGVQIYECRATAEDPAAYAWGFKEPAATLSRGIVHYRGPNWQSIRDGSRVAGRVLTSLPDEDPAANIPDLLLEATANSGSGVLGDVEFIQRLGSQGGVGPSGPCDPMVDAEVPVPYTAQYRFFGAPTP